MTSSQLEVIKAAIALVKQWEKPPDKQLENMSVLTRAKTRLQNAVHQLTKKRK